MNVRPHAPLFVFVIAFALLASTSSAASTVGLGTATSFGILAGTGITNTGATLVKGDVGSFATSSQTGFGPGADSVTIIGTNHGGDSTSQGAKLDLVTAYGVAAGAGPTAAIAADLGGQTLAPGVHNSGSAILLTGVLTLDAHGDEDAVFVFQAGSKLTTATGSIVLLVNGTLACNVFWQVGSSAALGSGSTFAGNIMALTTITLGTGAVVEGRVLARNGAVTLETNIIDAPDCPVSIPFFPTTAVFALASVGAISGTYVIMRRRP